MWSTHNYNSGPLFVLVGFGMLAFSVNVLAVLVLVFRAVLVVV
jgi:hypothetical protein